MWRTLLYVINTKMKIKICKRSPSPQTEVNYQIVLLDWHKALLPEKQVELLARKFTESRRAHLVWTHTSLSPIILSSMNLSICLLRSAGPRNSDSLMVTAKQRLCECFAEEVLILYLLWAFKWHQVNQAG